MAGGVARDVDDLEVETEIREGNDISAFNRVIDGADIFSSGTEDRDLPYTEKLVDTADVITVMVSQEDSAKFEIPLFQDLENERRLSRIHNHCCWRG